MPRVKKAQETKKPVARKKTTQDTKAPVLHRQKSSTVEDLASCVVKNQGLVRQLESLGFKSSNPEGMTFEEAMICSQIASAVKGDIKAYSAIAEHRTRKKEKPLEKFLRDYGIE